MSDKDKRLVEEIKSIVRKGNNAEIRLNVDGSYNVYEVKKKKSTIE